MVPPFPFDPEESTDKSRIRLTGLVSEFVESFTWEVDRLLRFIKYAATRFRVRENFVGSINNRPSEKVDRFVWEEVRELLSRPNVFSGLIAGLK